MCVGPMVAIENIVDRYRWYRVVTDGKKCFNIREACLLAISGFLTAFWIGTDGTDGTDGMG